jgi:hypothetical protein
MEVIFFNLSLEWILVMKISEISANQASRSERAVASATLLARSCFVVSIQLNLLFWNFSYLLLCSRDSCAKE